MLRGSAPADDRKPLDSLAVGLMLLLCLIWSMQQVALKATAHDFSPMLQIAVRSGIGALLVAALMAWRREPLPVRNGIWVPGLAAGSLFAVEYMLVGEGLRHTSAAHMTVFLYTAPIFAALGLQWKLPSERLNGLQWAGILIAFLGVAVSFLLRDDGAAAGTDWQGTLWGDFLGLLGGAAWGATTVVIRSTGLTRLAPTQVLLYQLIAGFVLLTPVAWLTGNTVFIPGPLVWASLSFQAVIMSFVSFLIWFWLLRHYLASRLGVFSFLTPVMAVLLGAWLLNEPVEPSFLAGSLLVLTGVVMVSAHGLLRQWLARGR